MILFYPTKLKGYARVKLICDKGLIPYTQSINDDFDIIFNHDHDVIRDNPVIEKLKYSYPVINGRLNDVTKSNVDKVFTEVFGYSSFIDPLKYPERYVRKSELQGDKSGRVFSENQKPRSGFVYQRLINNVVNGYRIDYRVYVINQEIVWIREKWKNRIIEPGLIKSRPAHEAFSYEERRKILDFCEVIGMDYGELDILREDAKGKLYIVDVNDIPGVRKGETKQPEYIDELKTLTRKFKNYVNSIKVKNQKVEN